MKNVNVEMVSRLRMALVVREKIHLPTGKAHSLFDLVRNLYTACTTNKECWSEYCFLTICQCPPGSEPTDNVTTCRK